MVTRDLTFGHFVRLLNAPGRPAADRARCDVWPFWPLVTLSQVTFCHFGNLLPAPADGQAVTFAQNERLSRFPLAVASAPCRFASAAGGNFRILRILPLGVTFCHFGSLSRCHHHSAPCHDEQSRQFAHSERFAAGCEIRPFWPFFVSLPAVVAIFAFCGFCRLVRNLLTLSIFRSPSP